MSYVRFSEAMALDDGPTRTVPCADCGTPCEIAGFVWEFAKQATELCFGRGWPPLAENGLTRCKPCGEAWERRWLDRQAKLYERAGQAIRLAKEHGRWAEGVREKMIEHGYKDSVEGVEDFWKRQKEKKGAARKSKGDV